MVHALHLPGPVSYELTCTWVRNSLAQGDVVVINTLRPRQNGRHFADNSFKRILVNENVRILMEISLKFVLKGPINNIQALVQIMACAVQATSHYLNQCWFVYRGIYASLGLNELILNAGTRVTDWICVILLSDECHRAPLMISQHWFR